jgi:hypothetical protein
LNARFRGVQPTCRSKGFSAASFSASKIARAAVSSSGRSISSAANENLTNALEIRHFCRADFAERWRTRKGLTLLHRATPERLSTFSDGVFAVLITVLVLELRPPEIPTFNALLALWPTWLSYAVSYLFIAIVWTNHHYLMRYATEATSRLLWFNFAHLFSMSLLPLSTAWMAVSKLAPEPVAFMRQFSSW